LKIQLPQIVEITQARYVFEAASERLVRLLYGW
jgi:hypothetical protein